MQFPSMMYKHLVNSPITTADVKAVDVLSFKIVEDIQKFSRDKDSNESVFNKVMKDVKFSVHGSDQKLYELVPGGANISLTWNNKSLFCDALERYRLGEFKEQIEAIRRGLATVVPYKLLPLLSWQELETLVCGSSKIDVEFLKGMTTYDDGITERDAHIQIFWRMMRERFDDRQRAQFLQFTWGRSRLPMNQMEGDRLKIQGFHRAFEQDKINRALPISHTCFFSIELPKYSTLDIMTERVTYAMVNCSAVDGDGERQHDILQTSVTEDADPTHGSLFT